jgi:hypothetical protein
MRAKIDWRIPSVKFEKENFSRGCPRINADFGKEEEGEN